MKFNTVKSKVVLFLSILTLLGTIFCIVSCDNFLSQNLGKTTININLDLSKLIKNSRNDDTQITGYVLKLFVYDAKNYQEGDKQVENLPLVTQTSNKVDINGTVKASLEVDIASTVIFVGKLYTLNGNNIESEKPLYAGKSDVYKVLPYNNKIKLVMSRDKAEIGFDIELQETHEHTFKDKWSSSATHHWKEANCGHSEVTDFGEHSFDEYVSNNDATQTSFGTKTGECNICKYKNTVIDKKVPEIIFIKGTIIIGATIPETESLESVYKGVFIEDRTVILSDFYMGKYEVTQEEYANVMECQKVTIDGEEYKLESNPSYCTKDSTDYTLFETDEQVKRPVEGVTWYDAVWYCNALSIKERLTPAYTIEVITVKQADGKSDYYIDNATVTLNENATGYRLPTEAEWEFAARGGDPTQVDWDYAFSGANKANGKGYEYPKDSDLDSVGWYCYNNKTGTSGSDETFAVSGSGTHQVGKKTPNILGLYDMSGNVIEWCYDYWNEDVSTGSETNPTGAVSGISHVTRGGFWRGDASSCLVCYRNRSWSNGHHDYRGFRVVRSANTTD